MFDAPPPVAIPARNWVAELSLRLERREARTVLAQVRHLGPLRVQKALYPESAARADVLILHPPAGIAGGDVLRLDLHLDRGAQARITTPGAAKWYRSTGSEACQETRLDVGDGAVLEWLPQEAIMFDGARARTITDIVCTETARACGWDLWMLGRGHAGERFARGGLRQRTRLFRGNRLLWSERVNLCAQDALRASPLGWDGATAMGTFWALGLPRDESLLEHCRAISEPGVRLGLTRFDHGLWLARALGDSMERVRAALARVWAAIRLTLCGAAPAPPRIWAT